MKRKMLSEKKKREERKRFITKFANFMVMTAILSICFLCVPCFAEDNALTSAQNLLSKAATAGGGLWAVWGLVQLGMSIKDHNGPGIQGAIWQLIGGAIIMAAALLIGGLDLDMTTTS